MLTFGQELSPSYSHRWKNIVSTATQTQYSQDDEGYHLKINLPGFRREDIDISVNKGVLEISVLDQAEAHVEANAEGAERVSTESSSWRKRYQLPDDVDVENITAELKLGQLLLTLSKKPQAKARKIAIQS